MAGRIRSLKPEVLDNARTAGLSDTAFRLFVALILGADDYGNGYGDLRRLRSQVWWATDPALSVDQALVELESADLVAAYKQNGQSYLHLRGWDEHQRVDKPGRPRVPGPDSRESRPGVDDRRSLIGDRRSEIGDQSRLSRETPATLPGIPGISRETPAKGSEARAHVVLAALSAARGRVIPGARPMKAIPGSLKLIGERLAEGASVDDCLHVIAVREAEVAADQSKAQWFNAQTPFRTDQFTRALAQTLVTEERRPELTPEARAERDEYRRIERLRAEAIEARQVAKKAARDATST